jgi:transcriptional regulator with XRE-family HTH domain
MPFRFVLPSSAMNRYEEFQLEKAQQAFDGFENSYVAKCARPSKTLKKVESFLSEHEMHVTLFLDPKIIGALQSLDDYINDHYQLQLGDSRILDQINFSAHESIQVPIEKLGKSRMAKKNALPARLSQEHIYSASEQIFMNSSKDLSAVLADCMQEKEISLAQMVLKSNLDRYLLSQILLNKTKPDKMQLCAIALALELNLYETGALLAKGGYSFSDSNLSDLIYLFFIEQEVFDVFTINLALYKYGQSLIYA